MQIENRYTKIFQPLLKAVDQDGVSTEKIVPTPEKYAGAILITRQRICEMQALAPKALRSKDGEVFYFREVWPKLYGRLFYYQLVHGILFERLPNAAEGGGSAAGCSGEMAQFFQRNAEFWLYYTARSPVIDGQFTREYSRESIFDPLCLVIDPAGATLASYRAAWGLAYSWYLAFQERQKAGRGTGTKKQVRRWKESKTAALEMLKSMELAGSVEIDGSLATMAQLVEIFEETYDEDLPDYNKLLYAATGRKINTTPYLSKLVGYFNGRKSRLRK